MKIITALIFPFFFISPVFSQSKYIRKFEYTSLGQHVSPGALFTLYYIIDSSKTLLFEGRRFYAFTISADSLDETGFISKDKRGNKFYFLSKYYKDKILLCKDANKMQTIFQFNNSITKEICYAGFLGSGIKIRSSIMGKDKTTVRLKILYKSSLPSETVFITEMLLNKQLFPVCITFFDPAIDKIVKCCPTQPSLLSNE